MSVSAGAFSTALRAGLSALCEQRRPLLILQSLVAAVVACGFLLPGFDGLLRAIGERIAAGGAAAVFVTAGLSCGLLAEAVVVTVQQRGRWRSSNLRQAAFRFALYGANAVLASLFFRLQAAWFGDGLGWSVQLPKLAMDRLVAGLLLFLLVQLTAARLNALHFDLRRWTAELAGPFVRLHSLPGLATQLMFWPPVTLAIYLFPVALQTILFLVIGAAWSLLVAALAGTPQSQTIEAST